MSDSEKNPSWTKPVQWISWIVALAAIFLLVRALPIDALLEQLRGWVEGFGAAGPAVFAGVYAIWTVAFLPGAALTLVAGALFGLGWGVVAALGGAVFGAALAFLIARYFARERVEKMLSGNRKLAAVDEAIGEGGWKVVAMMRLSPAFPFNLQNYFYGVTSIGFWPCILASAVFMLPGTFLYVYLGHIGAQGLAAASGGAERGPAQWVLLGVGLLATVAVTIYITRLARKRLQERAGEEIEDSGEEEKSSAPSPRSAFVSAGVAAVLLIAAVALMLNPQILSGWFGPPQVALAEEYEPKPDGPTFDHSTFDAVLSEYVDEHGMVDYQGLAENPDELDAYIASLAEAPFDSMGRNEKLALLINAYNAFTLRLILDHLPVESIRDIPAKKRWEAKRWNIGGDKYSLNQIEHKEIRPKFVEPRIHFALVCAAVSCPKLRQEAYLGDRIDQQLEEQTQYVHDHEKWFRFDQEANKAYLTPLYDWYGGDFEQVAGSVLKYVARYSPELEQALASGQKPKREWLDYDWSLNAQ